MFIFSFLHVQTSKQTAVSGSETSLLLNSVPFFPSFVHREAQVSALLKLKANLSKAHRKTIKATLSDALKEAIPGTGSHPFFSNI